VTGWLTEHEPGVLLLKELKGTVFPDAEFKKLGYESVAVTQKAYNGVAVISRLPIETINKALAGDEAESRERFLETTIGDIRIVNIYLPTAIHRGASISPANWPGWIV
jgi:exodeoxyribonuclease-3